MAHMCRLVTGSAASCAGWVGVIVATATNDWVRTCEYALATCIRMDELALCGIISTVWFPIGSHQEEHLMSFGFSLYAGWVGSGLCLLGGFTILCCQGTDPGTPGRDNSFYYSRQRGTATPLDPPANHAKSARV
ncbi:hypothetical protein F7725_028959 [Dissostichus mawsoni]|uniref:Claudin-11 n=1 Tax=Dissostichus mawsoni TaxID=36200 RepID=A0A7J5XHL3_DISMA|nr:hypothetical protein F7725_028959 [Dissostichus mawsoni]